MNTMEGPANLGIHRLDYALWIPGEVRLHEDLLCWRTQKTESIGRRPPRSMLEGFRRLYLESDEGICRFAQKHGALLLCTDHGLPFIHDRACYSGSMSHVVIGDKEYIAEPLAHWRRFSRLLDAICNVGIGIAMGNTGAAIDWDYIMRNRGLISVRGEATDWRPAAARRHRRSIQWCREMLEDIITTFLENAMVRAKFQWDPAIHRWRISFAGLFLYGCLSIQTMLYVADTEGFALCSSCQSPYLPARRPDPTRRNYCPDCGVQAAWRDAARDARERRRTNEREKR